ncbi:hypothetical protein [Halorubrum sp. DTA98]|uniref:hypothetical protein n=1 Tax=Halorubrum sp. DTA98 TaxID=3402163 RepID=UPI003AAA368B
MRIRDALESDAEALTALTGRPEEVLVDMVHDRSVRVALADGETSDHADTSSDGSDVSISGFIAFDARSETVHVTDFGGPERVVRELFEEPRRFAVRESMNVEVVVADDDSIGIDAVEGVGFDRVGSGPRFDGRSTTRFRLDPTE